MQLGEGSGRPCFPKADKLSLFFPVIMSLRDPERLHFCASCMVYSAARFAKGSANKWAY